MAATNATFWSLSHRHNRVWKARMAGLCRVAIVVAMYRMVRPEARPPHTRCRLRKEVGSHNGPGPCGPAGMGRESHRRFLIAPDAGCRQCNRDTSALVMPRVQSQACVEGPARIRGPLDGTRKIGY